MKKVISLDLFDVVKILTNSLTKANTHTQYSSGLLPLSKIGIRCKKDKSPKVEVGYESFSHRNILPVANAIRNEVIMPPRSGRKSIGLFFSYNILGADNLALAAVRGKLNAQRYQQIKTYKP